jgi:hypothetical protein
MIDRYLAAMSLVGLAGITSAWLLEARLGASVAHGVMLGAGLATAGAVAGMLLSGWAFERAPRQFLATLMLGILGRLIVYGSVLVFVVLRTTLDLTATAGSLLAFYVLHQVLEIRGMMRWAGRTR